MLFNLFGEKEADSGDDIFVDKVYIRSEGKRNACLQLAKEKPGILFIGWFSETVKTYKDFFVENGMPEVCIKEARLIDPAQVRQHPLVFLEHYPLHATEIALIEKWEQKNILVFSSMDEPLFKHFGSDKMIPLIKLFGMKESEAIEHSFVTKSITKGQQKIADRVTAEQAADSQAEWMIRNLPVI